jgi:deoxyribodipyrimidine photo-lyase
MKKGLYWFQHDLRLSDNPALTQLARSVEHLVAVYCFAQSDLEQPRYAHVPMGPHRYRFIREALAELKANLAAKGVELIVAYGEPVETISSLISALSITHVGKHDHTGYHERQAWQTIQKQHPEIKFSTANAATLYNQMDLPMSIAELPGVFTQFRKKVEKLATPKKPISAPAFLPETVASDVDIIRAQQAKFDALLPHPPALSNDENGQKLRGGESVAQAQLEYYSFSSNALSTYKETRNGLDGWDFSSKLSAWLATGCVSPRQVLAKIEDFEQKVVANDSTYWLFFELLWREFFQWHALSAGYELFTFAGVQQQPPYTKHIAKIHQQWVNGTTPCPIINACMNQLRETGFMSNRGRQLVASCYVHELGQDWRYGAAYFESMLIDYDPASNYGNWQYLAGVGCDPRGHRQFNLQKQTEIYDPQQTFIRAWT